jgi:hypothetical protein
VALSELFGRFNGGGIVRVIVQESGYNGIELPVDADDVGAIIWHGFAPYIQARARNSQSPIEAVGPDQTAWIRTRGLAESNVREIHGKSPGKLGKPGNALYARIAAGRAKATPTYHGRVRTPAPAAHPALPAHVATRATTIRGCRRVLKPHSTRKAGVISNRGWKRPFDDPIPLQRGRHLATLEDAGEFITRLPKSDHEAAEWQAAMEALILVATLGGPTMFARIGVMRALNRHVERVFNPDHKEHHWGRRKLARDQ